VFALAFLRAVKDSLATTGLHLGFHLLTVLALSIKFHSSGKIRPRFLVDLLSGPLDGVPGLHRRDSPTLRAGQQRVDALEMVFRETGYEAVREHVDDLGTAGGIVGWWVRDSGNAGRNEERRVQLVRVRDMSGSHPWCLGTPAFVVDVFEKTHELIGVHLGEGFMVVVIGIATLC